MRDRIAKAAGPAILGALLAALTAYAFIGPTARTQARTEQAALAFTDYFEALAEYAQATTAHEIAESHQRMAGAGARIAVYGDRDTVATFARVLENLGNPDEEEHLVRAVEQIRESLEEDGVDPKDIRKLLYWPLTASFHKVPEHDGESPFTFELRFNRHIALSYRTLLRAFEPENGDVVGARRLEGNLRWAITVKPTAHDDITIGLPNRPCGEEGAICTRAGRRLLSSRSETVYFRSTGP